MTSYLGAVITRKQEGHEKGEQASRTFSLGSGSLYGDKVRAKPKRRMRIEEDKACGVSSDRNSGVSVTLRSALRKGGQNRQGEKATEWTRA